MDLEWTGLMTGCRSALAWLEPAGLRPAGGGGGGGGGGRGGGSGGNGAREKVLLLKYLYFPKYFLVSGIFYVSEFFFDS